MPQKLNKAGKMQDYIPAGNGDPSGEYGTSKGTNKNFTKPNVITENKSVSVDSEWLHKKIDGTAKELTKTKDNNTIKKVYGTEEERDREGAKKLGVSLEEYKKLKEQHKKEMADIFEDKETYKNRLNKILEERNQNEDIQWAEDTDYFGFGSLDKLEEAHKNNYGRGKANIIDDDLTPSGIIDKGVDKAMDEFFEKNLMREDFITANKKDWISENNKGSNQYQIREILLGNDKTGLKEFWQADAQDTKWKVKNAIEKKYNAKLKEYATKKISQLKALNKTQNGIDKERTKKGIKELEDLIKDI